MLARRLLNFSSQRLLYTRMLSTRTSDVLKGLRLSPAGSHPAVFSSTQGVEGSGDRLLKSTEVATGEVLGKLQGASVEQVEAIIAGAKKAQASFRHIPAAKRGEVLRQIRNALNDKLQDLGELVSLEMGKVSPCRPSAGMPRFPLTPQLTHSFSEILPHNRSWLKVLVKSKKPLTSSTMQSAWLARWALQFSTGSLQSRDAATLPRLIYTFTVSARTTFSQRCHIHLVSLVS